MHTFASNKTSKNIQCFTFPEIKVIQSVQTSPRGHETTPNEGTIPALPPQLNGAVQLLEQN